jgi:hypothetical protein
MRGGGGALVVVVAAALAGAALGAACDTVDQGAPPADINACRPSQAYFVSTIWPMVLSADYSGKHCYDAGCHDPPSSQTRSLILNPNPQPATNPPVPLTGDWAANYLSATEQMSCTDVASSRLLTLPSGVVQHGGGMLFKPGGPEATDIQNWVTAP